MTVSSQTSRISYTGDGATTAFAVPFYFQANADIVVYVRDAGGTATLQTLGTKYTLTGATLSAGGTCTFVTAPTSGYTVIIYRDPQLTQTTSYNNNDAFPAKAHELALDKAVTIDQRTRDLATRSVRLSDGDSTAAMEVPTLEIRKGKVAGFAPSTGAFTVGTSSLADMDSVVSGALATSGGFNRIVIAASLTVLRATTPFSGAVIYLEGNTTPGDYGAGVFIWSAASVATDDGSEVVQPNAGGVGRWLRAQKRKLIGEMSIYAGTTAPDRHLFCYGQSLLRASYPDLFAILSTTYGAADGTHFSLPDLRGRVAAGADNMGGVAASRLTSTTMSADGNTLGATGGAQTKTLITANLPAYTPTGTNAASALTATATSTGNALAAYGGSNPGLTGSASVGSSQVTTINSTVSGTAAAQTFTGVAQGGTSTAFDKIQPTIILNYIIYAGV